MRFVCEKCRTKYSIADEKVRKKVLKIRCKKCRNIIVVREPASKAKGGAEAARKKRDRLDDEFEKAFDRLTGGNKKPEQPDSAAARRTDAGLEREFGGDPVAGEEWFAILRGEQVGPMTLEELQAAVTAGKVLHGTYVWRDGMDDWVRAARCPDVRHLLPEKRKPAAKGAEASEKQPAEKKDEKKPEKKAEKKAEKKPEKKAPAAEPDADGAAFEDETRFSAPAAGPGAAADAPADEDQIADVLAMPGRDEAAEPTAEDRAPGDADGGTGEAAGDEAAEPTAEERWEEEERRAAEMPGMPPPMPEDEDEIIIAPAITGKLVTLRAALAMVLAASMLSIIGTAVVMEILAPDVVVQTQVKEVKKKKARSKIVLTPELLALKSKLFGEDRHSADRRHAGRRHAARKAAARAPAGSGLVPSIEDTGGGGAAAAGLEAAMARVGQGIGEERGTRGGGEAADGGPLAGVAVDSGGAGLPGGGRTSAIASSGGYGRSEGRRSGADVSAAGGPLPDGLSGEVVAARFQGRWIETCYNRALKRDPGMKGKMVVSFEIGNSGRVRDLDISPRTFRGTFLAQCFSREIKKIRFPRFRGEPIPIEYPFILSAR